ncbi:phosphoglycolate phosphatase [Afipia sp. P52-10]|uniref:HAD hydrolase-like protein n=1 Tax=Afipia sp. P52-10 TaxID=1429916 RepID=UPI0003DF0FD1|nr:HAD hydrolase-like protein [Afipia sp. P52-10]ETR74766.1 phosphoglycolate phosphatase [Afipia sp. P52-10]
MAIPPLVVFDLDGTLVDTAPDLVAALNVTLRNEGISELPLETARNMIGGGARKLIERGLEAEGYDIAKADIDRMMKAFITYYSEHIADLSRPFEGLDGALDDLAAKGCSFAVCTNKLEWLSKLLIDRLNLTHRFAAICGADTFGIAKPDPSFLRQTVAKAGGEMASTVMVGDAGTDVGVARRAGVPVVGVTFGYTETPIEHLNPDRIISHMRELPQAVVDLLPRQSRAATKSLK